MINAQACRKEQGRLLYSILLTCYCLAKKETFTYLLLCSSVGGMGAELLERVGLIAIDLLNFVMYFLQRM